MKNVLEPLLEKKFIFVDDYAIDVYELTHVNLCKENEPYCEGGKLLIPRINLFHQGDNSTMYINRFMEDLMMNTYIQRTLLEEIHSTLYYTDRYILSEHEILLLESELTAYLEKEPVRKIHSAHYPLLEDVAPNKILEYVEQVKPQEEDEKIVLNLYPEDPEEDPEEEVEGPVQEKVDEPEEPLDEPYEKVEEPVEEPVEEQVEEPVEEMEEPAPPSLFLPLTGWDQLSASELWHSKIEHSNLFA
jgi:hypothetical protein